jgi:exodeoxyribonuclease VII small subunit
MSDDTTDDPSYSDAIDELESILGEIESDEVDVDDLASKVQRASELVQFCRETIDETEMQIESIIEDLREDDETGGRT